MPEPANIVFSYQEIVKALLKTTDIRTGEWGLFIRFGLTAANLGENDQAMRPAAIIPVLEIGLQKAEKPTNLSVNAAEANPAPK